MTNKIQAIQKLMQQNNIDLLWISDADPHFNEYVHPHWQLRSYLSGFDGSNGVLIIEKDECKSTLQETRLGQRPTLYCGVCQG